jgi:hypothetical protein
VVALAAAGLVGVGGVSALAGARPDAQAQAQPAACPAAAADRTSAVAAALRCGTRVELLDSRTEKEQVFAEPSGALTLEATAVPVRVHRTDGSWVPVDTTLARAADGSIAPAATSAAVRFSGGGTQPLVTLVRDGHTWALSWPAPLPVPSVDGSSATYPEVLPGVDLVVTATLDGFTHVLVVKNAAAAANPTLREVRYRLDRGGARTTADGGLVLTADDGSPLASGGTADMWDATGGEAADGPVSSAAGPGARAKRARMGTRVTGGQLVITPDAALLTGAGVRFPIYLDPAVTIGESKWTYANNDNTNNADGKAWVGEDPWWLDHYRSFFDFSVSSLRGKHILDASLEAKLYHSWSCASTPVWIYRTNKITATPRATWSSMDLQKELDNVSAHAHKGDEACGNQPDVVMWFDGSLRSDVQTGADDDWTTYTIGFCACSDTGGTGEGTTDRWKKFYPTTVKLHVTYNSYPATPSSLATTPTTSCTTGSGRPAINTWTPLISAVLTDVDSGATLQADFSYSIDGGTTFTAIPRTAGQKTGLRHTVTMPNKSSSAPAFITWRVRAWDGTDASKSYSSKCEFTVDTQPPADPQLDTTALPAHPAIPPSTVVVGTPVLVPVAPNGDTDVIGYWFVVADAQVSPPRQTYVAAAANGTATLSVTPVVSGISPNWLTVQAVDRAGNFSTEVTHLFRANPAS